MNVINAQTQIVVKEKEDSVNIDTARLLQSIAALDKALLNKDSVALAGLLNDDVEIKHSNGWVQGKEEVFKDFRDSTLSYGAIENLTIDKINYRANIANVKRVVLVEGIFETYHFKMKLAVSEVWIYENKQWQLWGRQAEKLN